LHRRGPVKGYPKRGAFSTVTVFQRILCTELLQRLTEFQPALARAVALAAEVDCLISLAQVARDFNYCRPVLTEDNVLHIKQGVSFAFSDARYI
jgi:DNA mismatch repair ATPase MutS